MSQNFIKTLNESQQHENYEEILIKTKKTQMIWDRLTDRRTDRPTDIVPYTVACTRLKGKFDGQSD